MKYLKGMETIDSDIMDRVLKLIEGYNYRQYTAKDVEKALAKEHLLINDFAAILSPAAVPYLEYMARKAMSKTKKHFGNSVCMFTPLYISNYCENYCTYCGFSCHNKITRGMLSLGEVEEELKAIALTGLKEILLLTGESRHKSSVKYIGKSIKLAAKYFSAVCIEIYPLNSEEYAYLHKCGADFVSVYQETYNTEKYGQVHLKGPKQIFPYRFYAQERALLGGMRGVAFGALLGLDNFRKDVFATGLHGFFTQQKFPHAEVSFSTPRLRPYLNNHNNIPNNVREKELLQAILAYRLFMPFAGITISTRERPVFRDHIIGMAATKISAGVKVGVGGHKEKKGDEQFVLSDLRSVKQIHGVILSKGLQPVYTDYIRV